MLSSVQYLALLWIHMAADSSKYYVHYVERFKNQVQV